MIAKTDPPVEHVSRASAPLQRPLGPFPPDRPQESDAVEAASDAVEAALARGLADAAAAGRFDVVAQIARELEARRLARSDGRVVPLKRSRGRPD